MASSSLIESIKILRERTGAGMMDCKKALIETGEDIEKAIDWLREKGIAKAAAKSARIAAEGVSWTLVDGNKAIIGEVNCETDFVSKGEKFHKLAEDILSLTLKADASSIDEAKNLVAPLISDATVALGEKMDFRRYEILSKEDGEGFGAYIHMGGKIAVLVKLSKDDAEAAKGIAMHIAANNPSYIDAESIPSDVIEHERKIALEASKTDEKLAGKPEAVIAKIVEGKVKKFLSEQTLIDQTYLMDGEKSVAQFLKEKDIKVIKFFRYAVGEGIQKREDNFAEEVMSQIK